jgi:hypothetical protein
LIRVGRLGVVLRREPQEMIEEDTMLGNSGTKKKVQAADLVVPKGTSYLILTLIAMIVGIVLAVWSVRAVKSDGLGFIVFLVGFALVVGSGTLLWGYKDSFIQVRLWNKLGLLREAFPQDPEEVKAARNVILSQMHQQAAWVGAQKLLSEAVAKVITAKQQEAANLGPWVDLEASFKEWREKRRLLALSISYLTDFRDRVGNSFESSKTLLESAKDTFIDGWILSDSAGFKSAGELVSTKVSSGIEACLNELRQSDRDLFNGWLLQTGLNIAADREYFEPDGNDSGEGQDSQPQEQTLRSQEA